MRCALIVIDLQAGFFERHGPVVPPLAGAVEIINHVAAALRAAGHAVIWVSDYETIDRDDPRGRLLDSLDVDPADPHLAKLAENAFLEPELGDLIEELGVGFVWFCGYQAEQCVLATARGAADRGLPFALLRGATLGLDAQSVAFVERLFPLASHEVVTALCSAEPGANDATR